MFAGTNNLSTIQNSINSLIVQQLNKKNFLNLTEFYL